MNKHETWIEFIGTTAFRAALIMACTYVGVSLARADEGTVAATAERPAPNLIARPDYTADSDADTDEDTGDENVQPDQKLQYEPTDDEKPVILERDSKDSKKAQDGSIEYSGEYDQGRELMVSPAPDFAVKEEKIEEKTSDPGVPLRIEMPPRRD